MAKRRPHRIEAHGRIPGFKADERVLATDASLVNGRVGLGWLSNIGFWGAVGHPLRPAVTGEMTSEIAELRAVAAAFRYMKLRPPVTLLLDSQDALQYLNEWVAGGTAMPAGYQTAYRPDGQPPSLVELSRIAASRDVTLRWVPAHAGHPLNEAADSLSKIARRGNLTHHEAAAACEVIARNRLGDLAETAGALFAGEDGQQ